MRAQELGSWSPGLASRDPSACPADYPLGVIRKSEQSLATPYDEARTPRRYRKDFPTCA